MSSILYYSNYCEHSKKLLQTLSKSSCSKDMHFICIDKRIKDSNNKTFIILENGQRIILPENVVKVPALLLLNQGYNVLYGESILQHLKPRQETEVRQATYNNLEPLAFSFGGGGGGSGFSNIVSDQYSFLDQDFDSLSTKGNGGMRQMHNYVDLNYIDNFNTPKDEFEYKNSNRIAESNTEDMLKKMQEQREADIRNLTSNRPPMSY